MQTDEVSSTCSLVSCVLRSKLSSKVLSGLMSFGSPELELSSAQTFLLSLIQSMSEVDYSTSVFLIELSHQLRFPSHLRLWLEEDIQFNEEDVVRVFAVLARLKPPGHLVGVLLGLASKYKVAELCKSRGDNLTLDFLSKSDVPARNDTTIQTDSPIEFHELSEVLKNNSSAVRKQKKSNIVINYPKKPLNVAANKREYGTMLELLKSGADPEEKDGYYGNTGIHWAVKSDYVEALELYKQNVANMSICNNIEWTLLHFAANANSCKSLLWLLSNGADIEAKDNRQQTPLFKAAFNGHVAAARILLDHGANVNARDSIFHSPLYLAVKMGHTMVAKLLLEHDADVKIHDNWGKNLLHVVVKKGSLSLTKLLIEHNCDVNYADDWGRTPLHDAVQALNVEAITLFVNKGADIEAKDRNGCTPLYEAAKSGDMKVVRTLLDKGAYPDSVAKDGTTPSQVAKGRMIKRMLMAKRTL